MSDLTKDIIRYDVLAQDALRGVVRKVLSEVEKTGTLPGDHHFYITFNTTAPGVRISNAIKERYPTEMTIIIQHQFWDLKVTETRFEIGLSFSDVPEILSVPFSAVMGFVDPSVKFVLQFDLETEDESPELVEIVSDITAKRDENISDVVTPLTAVKSTKIQPAVVTSDDEVETLEETDVPPKSAKAKPKKTKTPAKDDVEGAAETQETASAGDENNVVSLDTFRKK